MEETEDTMSVLRESGRLREGVNRPAQSSDTRANDSENGVTNNQQTAPKKKRPLKLTDSQRERKRAIDREAQRSIRMKTKNYIAHLENLVKMMEENDAGDGNGKTRELMMQLRQSQDEVRRLRDTVQGVQRLVSNLTMSAMPVSGSERAIDQSDMFSDVGSTVGPSAALSSSSMMNFSPGMSSMMPPPSWDKSEMLLSQSSDSPTSNVPDTLDQYPGPSASIDHNSTWEIHPKPSRTTILPVHATTDGSTERRLSASTELKVKATGNELHELCKQQIQLAVVAGSKACANRPFDDDIMIRAVLHGWSAVEDHYELDQGWQALRQIDQYVFGLCGILERLAILQAMRLKLLHQLAGVESTNLPPVPVYYQRHINDPPTPSVIVEHFAWPGLRHAIYNDPQRFLNNRFSNAFRWCFRFLWPYRISDAYVQDPNTQQYSITPEMSRRLTDLRFWTMRKDLFDNFPELRTAMPMFDPRISRPMSSQHSNMMHQSTSDGRRTSMNMVKEQELEEQELDQNLALSIPVMQQPQQFADSTVWTRVPDVMPQYWPMNTTMHQPYTEIVTSMPGTFMT